MPAARTKPLRRRTGTTQADRLVEVEEPYESGLPAVPDFPTENDNDYYSTHWITRYVYDLSQDQLQTFDGTSVLAYGNLFETESYLSSPLSTPITSPHFEPIKAQGFDALDRLTDTLTTEVCADQFGTEGTARFLPADGGAATDDL